MATVEYSVLINAGITKTFTSRKWLRQGNPLSPYLFILCSEFLTRMMGVHEAEGNLHGIKMSRGGPAISHLPYADDILIMCRANRQEAQIVKTCFDMYYELSGQ